MEQTCILGPSISYWDSNEVWVFFESLDANEKYCTDYAASMLTYIIEELKHVINSNYGYKGIIIGGDTDNLCNMYMILILREKSDVFIKCL